MNQKLITNKCHISVSAMKLLIVLTFCVGFVVCGITVVINDPPSAPLDSGSAHSAPLESVSPPSPAIHEEHEEIPLNEYNFEYIDFINEVGSEEELEESTGYKNLGN